MKVIVGLGNPGKQYEETRHNAGFMVVDRLAHAWGATLKADSSFEALVGEGRCGSEKVILLEPTTFMNLSGRAIQKVLRFYKLSPDDLIVVYDDFAIALGAVRVRTSGSAGGHNGISSTIECLSTNAFPRVRVGIGPLPPKISMPAFVLSKFRPDEQEPLEQGIKLGCEAVEVALRQGFTEAMQRYNRTQTTV